MDLDRKNDLVPEVGTHTGQAPVQSQVRWGEVSLCPAFSQARTISRVPCLLEGTCVAAWKDAVALHASCCTTTVPASSSSTSLFAFLSPTL